MNNIIKWCESNLPEITADKISIATRTIRKNPIHFSYLIDRAIFRTRNEQPSYNVHILTQ